MENNFTEAEISESFIQHDPHRANFTTIFNSCVNDPRLEFKDLGLLLYMISKPPTWKIRTSELCKRGGVHKESIRSQLNRLEALGYIKREQRRSADGSWGDVTTYVNDTPIYKDNQQPETEKPGPVNTELGKTVPLVKTDVLEKKEPIKKEATNIISTNTARATIHDLQKNTVGKQTTGLVGDRAATRKMIDDALKRGQLDRIAAESKKRQPKLEHTTLQEPTNDD